ncbi:hypothetical protein [Streptomyces ziwulingensis]|uniref:Tetratricopeptide repeat protein n=1 Tax=Streptomyces ziwulingensis TaxID=1045501 RepID=A0ABP9C8R7_9ACTN
MPEEAERPGSRHTLGTWRIRRRFRHWQRPKSRDWPDVYEDIARLTRALGRRHPDTLAGRSRVLMWLTDEGRHAEAVRLAEAEVADSVAEFGTDDPGTLRRRRSLAWYRRRAGDLDGAVAEARAVERDSVRVLGPGHADTHRCRAALGRFLAENGEPAEGVRLLRALYAESLALGRQRRSETRSVRDALVAALESHGDLREALDLLDEEIAAERGTVHGVDENLGDHEMKRLREWRGRLVAKLVSR